MDAVACAYAYEVFLEELHVTCLVCTFTIAIMCACAALHHCIEILLNYNVCCIDAFYISVMCRWFPLQPDTSHDPSGVFMHP